MLFDSYSDVNFVTDVDLVQVLEDIVPNHPTARLQRGMIRSDSLPFPFTVTNDMDLIDRTDQIRNAFWTEPELLVVAYVISTWAKAAGLIRRTTDHVGQLPKWKLLLMIVKMLSRKESICFDPNSTEISSHWLETFERISNFDHNEQAEIGHQLLTFFRAFSLADRSSLIDKFATTYQIDISTQHADALIEHSFRAFHTLAQTLSINSVIATAAGAIHEIERDIRNPKYKSLPRLLHKYGASNALFMEGSSRIVFECARSTKDLIFFNLYPHRRRPHHSQMQCYEPVLREINNTSESFTSASTFSEFYLHASRQFNLAKGLGNASFGPLRAQIKYGHIYVTHLPRLFVEEAGSSTIEMIHLALSKGYKSFSINQDIEEGETARKDITSLEIGRAVGSSEEKKSLELQLFSISDPLEATPSDAEVKRRKKSTLSPMTSAFESSVTSTSSIIDKLVSFGFLSSGKSSGFSICTVLYDCDANRNRNLQLTYDDQLNFVRASFRPLRWLLEDIKSVEGESWGCSYCIIIQSSSHI